MSITLQVASDFTGLCITRKKYPKVHTIAGWKSEDKLMKKILCIISILLCIFLVACANNSSETDKGEKTMFEQITPQEAKKIMDSDEEHIILDAREQSEFDEGHISGAILIPYTEIEKKAEQMIPDKNAQILVYCRSGRRSKLASESLIKLGYTNVKEFGGIIDWPYEVVK